MLLLTACPPDGEGWDYRLAIRKDYEQQTRRLRDCPQGQHSEENCEAIGRPGEKCPEMCVPDK